MTATLLQLRDASKQKADLVNSALLSDDEWDDRINETGSELHDIIVSCYSRHFHTIAFIDAVAGTESYALPSDFEQALAAYWLTGGIRYPLGTFELEEFSDYQIDTTPLTIAGEWMRYAIFGDKLFLSPRPNQTGSIEFWYVSRYVDLTVDGSTLSYPHIPGWEGYISNGAAAFGLEKAKRDSSLLHQRNDAFKRRVQSIARRRNAGKDRRVTDVYGYHVQRPGVYRRRRRTL